MPRQARTLRELARIRAYNWQLLNAVVGNQGTALGRRNTRLDGEPCIIVYVPHKLHKTFLAKNVQVPKRLVSEDGSLEAPTDVVVTTVPPEAKGEPLLSDENQALVRRLQWMDGTLAHLTPGVQVGGYSLYPSGRLAPYFGTLGYCVKSAHGGPVGFLTNQHVGGGAGQSMYVPGGDQATVRIGVTRSVREHSPDDEWVKGINEPFAYVRSDAALVAVDKPFTNVLTNEIPNVGALDGCLEINLDSMDVIGMPVTKVGRTTGLTEGVVVAYSYGISHINEYIDRQLNAEPANIYTDFLIAPAPGFNEFSAPGDSGSPIFTRIEGKTLGLGLLWGGWPTDIGRTGGIEDLTYGIDLHRLLHLMQLELL